EYCDQSLPSLMEVYLEETLDLVILFEEKKLEEEITYEYQEGVKEDELSLIHF
ncbi:hypothetical protein KI387_019963, partial [Taxus chinensis]